MRGVSELTEGLIVAASVTFCGRLLTPDALLDFGGNRPLMMYNFIVQAHGFSRITEP